MLNRRLRNGVRYLADGDGIYKFNWNGHKATQIEFFTWDEWDRKNT